MAEEKKPIDSVPPPTDDIDEEWKDEEEETEESPAPAESVATPTQKAATSDDEEEDEEDEDDDDDEDGEDGDDEDGDDEDGDHEHEEDARGTSSPRGDESSSDDWLPDWAPWAVLGLLLVVGLLGGLGLLPIGKLEKATPPADSAAAQGTATATSTATAAKNAAPTNADAPEAISASHILIAYQGAVRANPKVTRTKEEARKLAEEVAKKAKSGANFAELVKEYSDEPRAAEREGNLGSFTRNRMVKPFSDAAFQLKVNQISDVVETQFGFHVIKRTQ